MATVRKTVVRETADPYYDDDTVVRRRVVDSGVSRSPGVSVVYYILNIIEVILALRLIFRLLGANPDNGLVNFLYTISAPLISPFTGIFRQPVVSGSVIEWSTVVAMIIYAIVAYLIVQLFTLGSRRTTV